MSAEEKTAEKKERVLHTRIPAALEEQIKRLAEGLRVPVSNLVRNMLEDAIDMTRRVRDSLPEAMGGAPSPTQTRDLSEVFGWQSLTLNITSRCARCDGDLEPGDEAFLGLTDRPRDTKVFICPGCLPKKISTPKE
jgi:hypothetical protein